MHLRCARWDAGDAACTSSATQALSTLARGRNDKHGLRAHRKQSMTDFSTIKQAVDQTGQAFDEFKKTGLARIDALQERVEELESKGASPGRTGGAETKEQAEHMRAFKAWMRAPFNERAKQDLAQVEADVERKAVTIGSGAAGGYALPEILDKEIERRVRQLNPFRGFVRTLEVGSSDFKQLVSMGDGTSGWVAESGTRTETTSPTLRERAPTMGTVYSYPKASEEAVADMYFDVAKWLIDEASDDFASAEATAVISGDGTAKPTGFLNATPTTGTDDSVSRAAGALQYIPGGHASLLNSADALFDLIYSVKERYLADPDGVAWVMSRSTMAAIAKLKATTNEYLLQPALAERVRPTLLGYPVFTCDAMPAVAANSYSVCFGNWRRGYLLVDRGASRITVDDNVTTPGQVKFYVRRRVGGCVLNNDAIKLIKTATT